MGMKINTLNIYSSFNTSSKRQTYGLQSYQPKFKSLNLPSDLYCKISSQYTAETFLSKYKDVIKKLAKNNLDAMHRILNCYKPIFCFKELQYFMDTNIEPNFIKLEDFAKRIINEEILNLYVEPLMKIGEIDERSGTNFDIINNFLDFRLKAIEKKELLNKYGQLATVQDVDDIVLRNIPAVNKTLELIGEDALIFSFKEKKDNVLSFIENLGAQEWDPTVYSKLMLLTNPEKTTRYKFLEKEIKRLKGLYPHTKEPEKLRQLQKSINTLIGEKREILNKSIKDPRDILEKALIVSALKNALNDSASEILKVLNPQTAKEREIYNQTLNKILYEYYDVEIPNDIDLKKLDFTGNKYLPRLFYTKQDFKSVFKNLILLLNANSGQTNLTVFNNMPKNLKTKFEFEKHFIDYDKWVSFDSDSKIEYKIDDNNILTAQKVDMNNIPEALFIGDEADCCTRVNGVQASSAVNYMTSKLIQAIEVRHNDIPIANTMCYLAKIKNRIVLVLDNIEVKKQYKFDEFVKNAIFDYAKQLVKDIDYPNMPVMLSNKRGDVKMPGSKSYYYDMEIIGSTGFDKVYLDCETTGKSINSKEQEVIPIELIPVTENAPIGREKPANESFYDDNLIADAYLSVDAYGSTINNCFQYFCRKYDNEYD